MMALFVVFIIFKQMNKDKLISLIIRKQTYKDTKSYLTDLLNLKQEAVKSSYQAIKQILTTDYNAQAKLYAVRYLKDAFQKGNPSFIGQVQKDILPILIGISIDETDQKSHMKYAGSSYTKAEQLSKFKAVVSSLFRMVKECIIKWAEWIPDQNRKFIHALNQIKKKNASLDFEWKYFRPENQQLFKQCCEKNGLKLSNAQPKPVAASKKPEKRSKDPLVAAVEEALQRVRVAQNQKELLKIENDFNEAINNYLQNAEDFKEEFVQESFDQFQKIKKEAVIRIKEGSSQKNKGSAAPTPATDPLPQDKVTKKVQQISSSKSKQPSSKPEIPPIQKNQSSIQKIQQKLEKKSIATSKKQIKSVPEQKVNRQIAASAVENGNNKKISQKQIIVQTKKVLQLTKLAKKEQIIVSEKKIKQPEIKSPRAIQQKRQKIIIEQQTKKIEQKPIIESNATKQSKIPTSPKRGPIKFDDQQSPFTSKKQSSKEQSKVPTSKTSKQQSGYKKQSKMDISASKQSERINFSDEDSSQFSQDVHHHLQLRDFKKKSQLTPIKQETSRGPPEQYNSANKGPLPMKTSSRVNQEESYLTRQKKGGITHKLVEENKHLMEKYEKLMHDFDNQMQEKRMILKQKQVIEKQLKQKTQNEEKLIKKLKNYIPIEDYNRLRKQLEQQRSKRQTLIKQNIKMRSMQDSLIEELNQTKYRLKNNNSVQNDKSRQRMIESQSNTLNVNVLNQPVSKPVATVPIIKQQIDQDYIKNLTHTSNLHNLLSRVNLALFKKNSLSQSEIFYRDQYVSIMGKSKVYTQNNQQFVSVNLTFQFKTLKQIKPQIRYKNCQELDLWSKPLSGHEQLYTQQLAIRLHSNPLKVIKVQVKVIEAIDIMFLLPILYINFLREQEFANEQFDDIFILKSQQLIKSKITQWNGQIIKQMADFHKLFKYSIIIGDKIRFCLSQGINDQIFMAQFQILRNNKFLLKILPIPYSESMVSKAKQLMQNIIFLLS